MMRLFANVRDGVQRKEILFCMSFFIVFSIAYALAVIYAFICRYVRSCQLLYIMHFIPYLGPRKCHLTTRLVRMQHLSPNNEL